MDIQRWIARYNIVVKRLMDAWMDLAPIMDDTTHDDFGEHARDFERHMHDNRQSTDGMSVAESLEACNQRIKARHRKSFPFDKAAFAQIFLVQSELSEQHRITLISQLKLRKIELPDYTVDILRDLFIELFAMAKTQIDNPNLRPRDGARSFLVLDVGDVEGTPGYWVEDEATNLVGFLGETEDVFWLSLIHI